MALDIGTAAEWAECMNLDPASHWRLARAARPYLDTSACGVVIGVKSVRDVLGKNINVRDVQALIAGAQARNLTDEQPAVIGVLLLVACVILNFMFW